jgi:hypothetical protein
LSKPDPPQPPNPYATAAAATGTNVGTAIANKYLNQVNQVTPQGTLNYNQTGSYDWSDPTTGQVYNIPSFTATQTPSAQQQAIQSQQEAAAYNLAGMANAQSGRVSSLLSTPFNPNSGGPARGDPGAITNAPRAQTDIYGVGSIQKQFGDAGDITRTYGPADNFSADRQRVEDSLMARMNPQLGIERKNIEQRLADQGIRYGSQAYASAMDDYNRQANDARFAAVGQAGAEQQRMNQMAGSLAAFQNAAQAQDYGQQLGRGSFANQGQAQEFSQMATRGTFNNAGLAQQLAQAQSGFNAQNAARNAYLQEQYTSRNQPINEITSLMSGGQVQAPSWINAPGSQIATTDIGGLINQNFNQQMGNYQAQNQNWQNTMGGILGAGAGLLQASDERIKENIVPMGTVFAADQDGKRKQLPISEWSYKGDPERHVGPMAQDVQKVDPGAVKEIGGVKHIYPERVMGSILRAA